MAEMMESFGSGIDEDVETMTAAEVLQKLEEAWLNEKFAPELLESKTEIIDCMMDQITEMEENIRRAKKGDFKVSLHRMEIDRIRFIITSYLRTRLKKIENYAAHVLEMEEKRKDTDPSHLSPEELQYAKDYFDAMGGHMKNVALRHMPANQQTLNPKHTTIRPNLDKYVFVKVRQDQQGVLVEEETTDMGDEVVDLTEGDQHIMRYRPVSALVGNGVISLV